MRAVFVHYENASLLEPLSSSSALVIFGKSHETPQTPFISKNRLDYPTGPPQRETGKGDNFS